jgi:DUF2946 family protein
MIDYCRALIQSRWRRLGAWLAILAVVSQALLVPMVVLQMQAAGADEFTSIICRHDSSGVFTGQPLPTGQAPGDHSSCPVCAFHQVTKIFSPPVAFGLVARLFGPSQRLQIAHVQDAPRRFTSALYFSRAPPIEG